MASAGARLQGTRVLVTGAASGIGRAVAERCVQEGATVAVLDLEPNAAERACAAVGAELALGADVTDNAAV